MRRQGGKVFVLCVWAGALVLAGAARAADVPRTAEELWAGFAAADKAAPLETEILKTWETGGIELHLVRLEGT